MRKVFITGACRTPAGKLLGKLSSFNAPDLGAFVISDLLIRHSLDPSVIDEVIMGNAISAGIGQNPARQAALYAGLPDSINAFTVNKVCASGLKAIALGVESIALGEAEAIVAGGMESMSNAPFILRDMRKGKKYGDSMAADAMVYDGLRDCYYDSSMGGLCDEYTVTRYGITREEQDAFALSSHRKAMEASDGGFFRDEIVPIVVDGDIIKEDETIRRDTDIKKLSSLKPAFRKNGTVTAGNSPGLNDGAAAVILMSEDKASSLGVKPLAEVLAFSAGHTDPKWYPVAPVTSVNKLLFKTGLKIGDFDLIEENEAFAAQTLSVVKELSMDIKKVNVHGGAIALGHPIGASGARLIVTLSHALKNRQKDLGLATLCLGGGGAMSMAIKAL